MTTFDIEQLKEKIQKAEKSVAEMKDETLKKSAFELILSSLLGVESSQTVGNEAKLGSQTNKWVKRVKAAGKKAPGQTREIKKSDISLTPEQLKQLKDYYESHKPEGEERSVFILACFLDEKLSKKQFHEGDINYIYQNLLPLKPSVRPPALDQERVKRSLVWLVSPSRRKMWLKANDDGTYEISSGGRLHIAYGSSDSGNKK